VAIRRPRQLIAGGAFFFLFQAIMFASPTGRGALAIQQNRALQCSAGGCLKHRKGLSPYCATHIAPASRYGHPSARPIETSEWAVYRREVETLFSVNAEHPGLVNALAYVRSLMARAAANERAFKGAEVFERLQRDGVTPHEVLTAVSALWCFLQYRNTRLPSQRAIDFALSRAVVGLRPLPKRVSYTARGEQSYSVKPRTSALAYLGKHLREVLGPFLTNVWASVSARDERARAAAAALREPLAAPTAAFLAEDAVRRAFHHLPGVTG
jgi:hypothetical protein